MGEGILMRLQGLFVRSGVLVVLAAVGVLGFSASAFAESTSYTPGGGSEQPFVVPAGVSKIEVTAIGGAGGSTVAGPGNSGAKVTATLTVTPGQKLYVDFGGGGAGANGGGNGGGASDVRSESGTLSSRLIVAGGGGGGGLDCTEGFAVGGGPGGDASGEIGEDGNDCRGAEGDSEGGFGGTQSAGGEGGHDSPKSNEAEFGEDGSVGQGGNGGSCGGGGGGGGYYGGGGGGGDEVAPCGGGGGGAGSSYITPEASGGSFASGAGLEQEVAFTYTATTPVCTAVNGVGHTAPKGKEGENLRVHLNTSGGTFTTTTSSGAAQFALRTLSSASCAAIPGGVEFSGRGVATMGGPKHTGYEMAFSFATEGGKTYLSLEATKGATVVYKVTHEPLTKGSRVKIS
jgi:hypothetical protein